VFSALTKIKTINSTFPTKIQLIFQMNLIYSLIFLDCFIFKYFLSFEFFFLSPQCQCSNLLLFLILLSLLDFLSFLNILLKKLKRHAFLFVFLLCFGLIKFWLAKNPQVSVALFYMSVIRTLSRTTT